ncbi:MAG: DUF6437 family protein [Pseudomonadota bacterium]
MTKQISVTEQLAKLERDKKDIDRREKALKEAVALKLGRAVISAGGLELDPTQLKDFLKLVLDGPGIAAVSRQLTSPDPSKQIAA